MNHIHDKFTKPKKIIFLILTIPFSGLIGAVPGFIVGTYAIDFIPDQCITEGAVTTCHSPYSFLRKCITESAVTTCQNPFNFLRVIGWEGTTALGFIIGGVLSMAVYIALFYFYELK